MLDRTLYWLDVEEGYISIRYHFDDVEKSLSDLSFLEKFGLLDVVGDVIDLRITCDELDAVRAELTAHGWSLDFQD